MREKAVEAIVQKFLRSVIVFGNWFLNWMLREHPELTDHEDVHKICTLLRELIEEEKHL